MEYLTLKGAGTAQLVVKRSVFIGYASPAKSEEASRLGMMTMESQRAPLESRFSRLSRTKA